MHFLGFGKMSKKITVRIVLVLILALVAPAVTMPQEAEARGGSLVSVVDMTTRQVLGTNLSFYDAWGKMNEIEADNHWVQITLSGDADAGGEQYSICGADKPGGGSYHINKVTINLNWHRLTNIDSIINSDNGVDTSKRQVEFEVTGSGTLESQEIQLEHASSFRIEDGAEVICSGTGDNVLQVTPYEYERVFEKGELIIEGNSKLKIKHDDETDYARTNLECIFLRVGGGDDDECSIELTDASLGCYGGNKDRPDHKSEVWIGGRGKIISKIHSENLFTNRYDLDFTNSELKMQEDAEIVAKNTDIAFSKPSFPPTQVSMKNHSSIKMMTSTSGAEDYVNTLYMQDMQSDDLSLDDSEDADPSIVLKNTDIYTDYDHTELWGSLEQLSPNEAEDNCYTVEDWLWDPYGEGSDIKIIKKMKCSNNKLANWVHEITIRNGVAINDRGETGTKYPGKAGYTDEDGEEITHGEEFTIRANNPSSFGAWTVSKGSTDILLNPRASTTTVTTPNYDVTITAGSGAGSGGGDSGSSKPKPVNPPTPAPVSSAAPKDVISVTDVTATGYAGVYDGLSHGISVKAIGKEVSVYYSDKDGGPYGPINPSFTDVGTHTVYYRVTGKGGGAVTGKRDVVIVPRDVVVSGIEVFDKYYDGKTDAVIDTSRAVITDAKGMPAVTGSSVSITGPAASLGLSVKVTGAFPDIKVGSNKTVTFTDLALTGEKAGNYRLSEAGQQTSDQASILKNFLNIKSISYKKNKKNKKKIIEVEWNKLPSAASVKILAANCGSGTPKVIKTVKGKEKATVEFDKLSGEAKKPKHIKVLLRAYTSDGTMIAESVKAHVVKNGNRKYTNAKKITLKKKSCVLNPGGTVKIKAEVTSKNVKKTLLKEKGVAGLRYISSDPSVATVDKGGKITAVAPGTCYVYVYALNGIYKKFGVEVK